jgi:ActR/RegA family two-component response regulator
MSDRTGRVSRVLVVDDEDEFLDLAVRSMPDCIVATASTADEARARCRTAEFDIVICDVFLGRESGLDLVKALYAENCPSRSLALVSGGFDVQSALILAKRLPPEIMIRTKRTGMFESILVEAATGIMPDELWQDEIANLDDAKREYVQRLLARVGNNRSEAARRLGVHRATVVRLVDDKRSEA